MLLEPDPYLAFLLRLNFPQADVIEADPTVDAEAVLALRPNLVIVGVGSQALPLPDLLSADPAPKILAVVDGSRAARTAITTGVDKILTRPFIPSELHRTVRLALGMEDPEESPGLPGPKLARARSLIGPARLAAVAVAAVLELAAPQVNATHSTILALAFGYVTMRWLMRRPSVVWIGADVAVAATLVAATDGVSSPYIPFALVVAAATGLSHNERWGGLAGLVIASVSTPLVVTALGQRTINAQEIVAWYALAPLAGVAGGFASRVWRTPIGEKTSDLLAEANRVLSSLYRIARTLPGGLEMGTVADAAMLEIRDTVRATAGTMLIWEAGNLAVVGSYGLRNPDNVATNALGLSDMVHGSARILTRTDLDPTTAQALGGFDCWIAGPMRRNGVPLGLLLAACPDHAQHAANRLLLQQIAQETTVAVENARLFSRVREISIDEERKRLARELHDGVAQALTHLRFELDFMARHGGGQTPDAVRGEIERLARVVNRAAGDVRSMIFGLRSSVSAEGLVGSLRAYLSDLRSLGGPEIVFEARGEIRLSAGIEAEIFRVAQEAVSNALRHASASEVRVTIGAGASWVRLVVEDDGIGIKGRRLASARGGVGLDAMKERAEAIGSSLDVRARPGGGTRVTLEYKPEDNGK